MKARRCQRRQRVCTTQSQHNFIIAPNLLLRQFQADAANRKWTADITYINTAEGWLYLAVILDLFSRRIVGCALADALESTLVEDAFRMAVMQRQPEVGLLHHSDRGSQYACIAINRWWHSRLSGQHEPNGQLSGQRATGEFLCNPQK